MADERATTRQPGWYWCRINGSDKPPQVMRYGAPTLSGKRFEALEFYCSDDKVTVLSGPLSPPGTDPAAEAHVAELVRELAKLSAYVAKEVQVADELRALYSEAIKERDAYKAESDRLEATARRNQAAFHGAHAERDKALAEVVVLKADRDALSTQVDNQRKKIVEWGTVAGDAIKERDALSAQVHNLEQRIEGLRNDVKAAVDDGKEWEKEARRLAKELQTVKDKAFRAFESYLEGQMRVCCDRDTAREQLKAATAQVADLERRLANCQADRNRALRYRDELREELQAVKSLDAAKARPDAATISPERIKSRLDHHDASLKIHNDWINSLILRIQELEDAPPVTP